MTCIAGIARGGHVYLGGDSMGLMDYTVSLYATGKVFRRDEFVMGSAGMHRFNNLVRYSMLLPTLAEGVDVDAYMVTEFASALRDCLRKGGNLDVENVSNETNESLLLVGVRGNIYLVDSAFSIVRPIEGIAAIGSGAEVALGALHVTEEMAPEKRVLAALQAAERWTNTVRGPFQIESL